MEQDYTSADTTEWEGLLESLSCKIERKAHREGWDQPASLWTIGGSDTYIEERNRQPWAFPVGFLARKRVEFEGTPTEALIGLRIDEPDVLGVALVTEGFGYSDEKLHALAENPNLSLDKPSDYKDSVEVRLVHLLFRDGTETAAMRRRGQDRPVTSAHQGGVGGRLAWSVRRTLGLPSGAPEPPFEQVRARAMAHTALSLLDSAREQGPSRDSLDQAAQWLTQRHGNAVSDMLLGLSGMQGENWEEAHRRAEANYKNLYDNVGGESVRSTLEFLLWCDSPMWANHIDENTPELSEISSQLSGYVALGMLSSTSLRALKEHYNL